MRLKEKLTIFAFALGIGIGTSPISSANLCSLDPESQVFFSTEERNNQIEISVCDFAPTESRKSPVYRHAQGENCKLVASFKKSEIERVNDEQNLISIADNLAWIAGIGTGYGTLPSEARLVIGFYPKVIQMIRERKTLSTFLSWLSKVMDGAKKPFSFTGEGIHFIKTFRSAKSIVTWLSKAPPLATASGVYYFSAATLYLEALNNRINNANESTRFLSELKRSLKKSGLTSSLGCFNTEDSSKEIERHLKLIDALIAASAPIPAASNAKPVFETKALQGQTQAQVSSNESPNAANAL